MRRCGVAVLVFFATVSAPRALGVDYFADPAGGSWTSSATWRVGSNAGSPAPAGGYPGSAAGDRAFVDASGLTVTVSGAVPHAVELRQTCRSCRVIIAADGALPLTGNSAAGGGATLQLDGTLGGGPLTVAGAMQWNGGTMAGAGATTITGSLVIGPGTAKTLARNLVVANGATATANDVFTFAGSASVTNFATWIAKAGMNCDECTGRFHNAAGALFSNQSTTGVTCHVRFDNDGTVTNAGDRGTSFRGGGAHTGDFNGGSAGFGFGDDHTFAASSDITASGLSLGSVIHNGSIAITGTGSLGIDRNAFCTLNGPVTTPRLSFFTFPPLPFDPPPSTVLSGAGPITITGTGTFLQYATLSGSGPVTILPGADFRTGGGSAGRPAFYHRAIDGRTVTNHGTLTVEGGIMGNGTIVNTGTATISNLSASFHPLPMTVKFVNQGGRMSLIGSSFHGLSVGGFIQTAGLTELAGQLFSPSPIEIRGGSFIGYGTVPTLINHGTLAPGNAANRAGGIRVRGDYTQSSSGTLDFDLGGPAAAPFFPYRDGPPRYDQLTVDGTATLAGTVNVAIIDGWGATTVVPHDVVIWESRKGAFDTVNLPPYSRGRALSSYEPKAFRILLEPLTDLAITKTGPSTAVVGQTITFTIQVRNLGPSRSFGVDLDDPTPANLTFVSNAGACTTPFPCRLPAKDPGQTSTVTSTYVVTGGAGTNIANTATLGSSFPLDLDRTNNTATATVAVEHADLTVVKTGPPRVKAGGEITFTITVANGSRSPAENVVVSDPTPAGLTFVSNGGACTTPFPCSLGTLPSGTTRIITATYSIGGALAGTSVTNTATVSTTTPEDPAHNTSGATFFVECINPTPDHLSPTGEAAHSGTLSWRGGGSSYVVYLGPAGSGCSTELARTTARSVAYRNLAPGTYEWRVESREPNCRSVSSACVTFTVPAGCTVPDAPVARAVGQTTSATAYTVEWNAVAAATRYEIEEATNPEFAGSARIPLTGTSHVFAHAVAEATAFYYRVRAFAGCTDTPGPSSQTVRVVVVPAPPKSAARKSITIPAGANEPVVQELFVAGDPAGNLSFSATTDQGWLIVRPAAGVITPGGITLEAIADPRHLPDGTSTASILITTTSAGGGPLANANANVTATIPFSLHLVTPVTPVATKPAPSPHALIVPSVGHLEGIGSHWQSDVRVTNTGSAPARYLLTFTPAAGHAGGLAQTTLTIGAGATAALDDVVANWFGLGTVGGGASGTLEILPLDGPPPLVSSRTYNLAAGGTVGQSIPAIPFLSFIGRTAPGASPQILSLQQVAQNAAYRTNVGLAEAAGAPASVMVSIFDASGRRVAEVPVQLAAGEQRQINQLLAARGIELDDGRIEVQVTGGDGRVAAYASVIDNTSQDPLLVTGELLSAAGATRFVLPGVANLFTGAAAWRTDMRLFNHGTRAQPATLTFFPGGGGEPKTASIDIAAGEVLALDHVLQSRFALSGAAGAVHVTTAQPSNLIVSGRTYHQSSAGTVGQFIPAVTDEQATGAGGRALHILQVEDSPRSRANIGLVEVSGRPALVELQIVVPGSETTPAIVHVPLAANELRQFNPIRALGLGHVYNGRIALRVVGGEGRVAGYGSIIDELTHDPTYIPAQ